MSGFVMIIVIVIVIVIVIIIMIITIRTIIGFDRLTIQLDPTIRCTCNFKTAPIYVAPKNTKT